MDTPSTASAHEALRPLLEEHLGHPVARVDLPAPSSPDVEEARRRFLGIWPGVLGNWSRLADLDRAVSEIHRQRDSEAAWWKVLQGYRLAQDEARLEEEKAQHQARLAGLFESALDNFAALAEAGAEVHFEEPPG